MLTIIGDPLETRRARFVITFSLRGYGRGCGVGRGLGVGEHLPVQGVGDGVGVGVADGVGVGVGEPVGYCVTNCRWSVPSGPTKIMF
jgi:hypothetical protein